jgi:AcrR family transcriptional regulator
VSRARRPQRRRLVQSQILTAAADRFHARGYRATTLDEIARDVGMSKATLYGYFHSKEQLLAAIFHRTMTLFERELARIRGERLPPDETLRQVIRHHVRTVIAERSFLAVFFEEEAHLPRQLGRAITRRKAGYDRSLVAIVEAARAQNGRGVDIPARLLVFALLGMSNWVYTWYRPGGRWSPESIAEAFITLIERGYRSNPAWRRHDVLTRLDQLARDVRALRPLAAMGAGRERLAPRTRRTR